MARHSAFRLVVRGGPMQVVVVYAGGTPGVVAGVMRVDVRVPGGTRNGLVPVNITVGTATSQTGVTVAVSGN